ncbi:MAG: hypothetical protein ACXWBP_05980 [Limisphaerales bacterium]
MRSRVVIISSLFCNVLLFGLVLYLGANRTASPPINPVQSTPSAGLRAKTNVVIKPFNWQQVESEDYKTFIANLRSIGCPEETIRDIVIADVNKLFAARERAVSGKDDWKFWRSNNPLPARISQERDAQLAALHEQKRAVIRALLGIELDAETAEHDAGKISHLDFLSSQKQAQILAIQNRFNDAQQRIYADAERHGVDWKQLKAAFDQRESELAQVLSSDELREYQLRKDDTADNLRRNLVGFEPTETEFRSLFQLMKAHEDKFSYADPADVSLPEQKSKDAAAVDEQIKSLLGDTRYAEYKRASNPQYQELYGLTQQFDLPADTAAAIFDRRQQMQKELSQYSTLSPDQQQQQVTRLQGEMDSMLRDKLGDKAYALLRERGIEHWLGN